MRYNKDFLDRMRKAWVSTPCEKCGAPVDKMCTTSTGKPAQFSHMHRRRRARLMILAEKTK